MKALVVFLFVANALAFAWWNGFLSQWLGDGREPERLQSQVAANKASLVPLTRLTPPPPASAFLLCIDIPVSSTAKAAELEGLIKTLVDSKAATLKLDKEPITEGGTFLVYLTASPTLKEAQRKLFELKRVGIDDVALINDGDLKWAISLGVFGTDDAGKNRMLQLSRVGIPGVKMAPRSAIVNKVAMKVRVTDADLKVPLLALSTTTLGAEAKVCQP